MKRWLLFLSFVLLLSGAIAPATDAATVTLTVEFTNLGEPLDDPLKGRFYLYEPGKRNSYLAWGHAARPVRVEAGVYDLLLRYVDGDVVEERVLEEYELKRSTTYAAEFQVETAHLTIEITAGGAPVHEHAGSFDVHHTATRGNPVASGRPGERLTLRPGLYDIEVRYRDPDGLQSVWLERYSLRGEQLETVDIGTAIVDFRASMTLRGLTVPPGEAQWELRRPGTDSAVVTGRPGERVEVAAGIYDLVVSFRDVDGVGIRTFPRIEITEDDNRTFELLEATGSLRVDLRNGDFPLPNAWFSVYRPGDRARPLASGRSGETVDLPDGRYDVRCLYRDGALRAERWLRDQTVEGDARVEVDLAFRRASLTIEAPRRARWLETANVLIVLDSSLEMRGSMNDRSMMELVARTLDDTIGLLDRPDVRVGLRVWGIAPREQADCTDSTLLLPLAPLDSSDFERTVDLIRPAGFSPIGYSLLAAADDLPRDERSTVVVISAGADSCSGDPCDAAARLIRRRRADDVHFIGLDVPREVEPSVDCAGTYHAVRDRLELRSTLRSVFRDATRPDAGRVTVFRPGRNRYVGSVRLDETLTLPEGRYDVLIRVGDRSYHWNSFEVTGDVKKKASERP